MHKAITLIFTGKLIKYGNFMCLPKKHVKGLISQGCLWNSFPAAVAKTIDEQTSINADRGRRYFEPSKTSFLKLIHHSFTIISVFSKIVFLRVVLISTLYFFLIYNQISLLNLLPLLGILIFLLIILVVSRREDLNELKNSLQNVKDIETLK